MTVIVGGRDRVLRGNFLLIEDATWRKAKEDSESSKDSENSKGRFVKTQEMNNSVSYTIYETYKICNDPLFPKLHK